MHVYFVETGHALSLRSEQASQKLGFNDLKCLGGNLKLKKALFNTAVGKIVLETPIPLMETPIPVMEMANPLMEMPNSLMETPIPEIEMPNSLMETPNSLKEMRIPIVTMHNQ